MSKPMVVTLPCILLLVDFWPLRRFRFGPKNGNAWLRPVLEKVPFIVFSAVGCVLTLLAQRQGHSVVSMGRLSLWARVAHAAVGYVHYLIATFVPHGLAVYYPYDTQLPMGQVIVAAALLVGLTVVALRFAAHLPYVVFGWFWFIITLIPVIGIVQVGDQARADRYTYLALIGLFVILGYGI